MVLMVTCGPNVVNVAIVVVAIVTRANDLALVA
jgi:hypothetical protein